MLTLALTLGLLAADPTIATIAGTGQPVRGPSLAAAAAEFNIGDPFGVEFGPGGKLYITEVRNHRILAWDPKTNQVAVVAGTGEKGYSGDGGKPTEARLNEPYEIRFAADDSMYFVEMQNHIIRKIDGRTGVISTVAGTGKAGFGGDEGSALKAQFTQPHSIALDGRGGLYVADIGNHRVRRIDLKTGTIDTIAGTGEKKLPVAGAKAKGSPVLGPRALYIRDDFLWLALREGHSVWQLDLRAQENAVWRHVAGTGERGYSGDGGPALRATFDGPKGIVVSDTWIDIVDTENQAIRRVDRATGVIATLAGAGPKAKGFSGDDGSALHAKLNRPHGICHGTDGAVYIGDTLNHRVRRIPP